MAKNDDEGKNEIEDHEESKSSMGPLITAIVAILLALVAIGLAILAMSNVPNSFSWRGAYYHNGTTFAAVDLTDATKAVNILSYGSSSSTASVGIDVSTWKTTGDGYKRVLRIVNTGLWNSDKTTQYPIVVTGMLTTTPLQYNSGDSDTPKAAQPTKISLYAGDYVEFIQEKNVGPTYIGMGLANGNDDSVSGFGSS